MAQVLLRAALRLGACLAIGWGVLHYFGVIGLVISSPIYGVLLSRVIIDLSAELHQAIREAALSKLSGQYYSFQGIRVRLVEDDDYCQWIAADQVRAIVGQGAPDRLLAATYPHGWCEMGKPPKGHLRDDALLLYLAKETSLRGVKFRVWVERNVAHQAKKQRERFGVRLTDPREATLHDTRPMPVVSTLPQA